MTFIIVTIVILFFFAVNVIYMQLTTYYNKTVEPYYFISGQSRSAIIFVCYDGQFKTCNRCKNETVE